MKNRYLVANPCGTFLLRCDTMEEATEFINAHVKRAKDAWHFLTNTELKPSDYQVRDLTEIMTFDTWKGYEGA